MKPQERTRAILTSKLEPAMRLVLVAVADFMGESEVCWPSVETLGERAGYCERQIRDLLDEAEDRGLIRRWQGEHRTRDIAIAWEVLAAAVPKESKRGGKRTPAKTAPQAAEIAGGKDCHPDRQSLPPQPAKIAEMGGKDCPRRDQEGTIEGTSEGTTPSPPSPGGRSAATPSKWTDAEAVYAAWQRHHPKAPLKVTPDRRKAAARILAECGSRESAELYLEWVHVAEDGYARQLRGKDPWPDGERIARHDIESLSRHIGKRMADAQAWDARGRSAEVVPMRPRDTPPRPAARPSIRNLLASEPSPHPERVVIDIPTR